jgi:hypothetical protein
MGFFGTYLFGAAWTQVSKGEEPLIPPPWLLIDIHDSDFTTVRYAPRGSGSGIAFLGDTPRSYFDDERESAPTDVAREAEALAAWWARHHGIDDEGLRAAKRHELAGYLAADLDPDDDEDFDSDDDFEDDFEDEPDPPPLADIFVEVKTGLFLRALGLPLPEDLPMPETGV